MVDKDCGECNGWGNYQGTGTGVVGCVGSDLWSDTGSTPQSYEGNETNYMWNYKKKLMKYCM